MRKLKVRKQKSVAKKSPHISTLVKKEFIRDNTTAHAFCIIYNIYAKLARYKEIAAFSSSFKRSITLFENSLDDFTNTIKKLKENTISETQIDISIIDAKATYTKSAEKYQKLFVELNSAQDKDILIFISIYIDTLEKYNIKDLEFDRLLKAVIRKGRIFLSYIDKYTKYALK